MGEGKGEGEGEASMAVSRRAGAWMSVGFRLCAWARARMRMG